MGKRKPNGQMYYSINTQEAKKRLKNIDNYMDELRRLIGKKGDGVNGSAASGGTLIGCVEGLNNEARDGKKLTDAYKQFNNSTLKTFKTQVHSLDFEFEVIDRIAR